jgi:hypothetical protein
MALMKAIKDGGGSATLKTVAGGNLTATTSGDKVVITDAKGGKSTVTIADVNQSNGVIHVVDTVLMPPRNRSRPGRKPPFLPGLSQTPLLPERKFIHEICSRPLSASCWIDDPCFGSPGPKSQPDGAWNVQLVTVSGSCERSYSYALAVQNGQVRLAQVAVVLRSRDRSPRKGGQPRRSEWFCKRVSLGPLGARSGSGAWEVPSVCSGSWTARRRTTASFEVR